MVTEEVDVRIKEELDSKTVTAIAEHREAAKASAEAASRHEEKAARLVTNLDSIFERVWSQAPIRIESGRVWLKEDQFGTPQDPKTCGEGGPRHRGAISRKVSFQDPFSSPPTVFVALNSVDHFTEWTHDEDSPLNDFRVFANVAPGSVTEGEFKLNFWTWCDTKLRTGGLSWVAYGP